MHANRVLIFLSSLLYHITPIFSFLIFPCRLFSATLPPIVTSIHPKPALHCERAGPLKPTNAKGGLTTSKAPHQVPRLLLSHVEPSHVVVILQVLHNMAGGQGYVFMPDQTESVKSDQYAYRQTAYFGAGWKPDVGGLLAVLLPNVHEEVLWKGAPGGAGSPARVCTTDTANSARCVLRSTAGVVARFLPPGAVPHTHVL